MESLIKPLNTVIENLRQNYVLVLQDLRMGKSGSNGAVDRLISDVKDAKFKFNSAWAQLTNSKEAAIATASGSLNPMPVIKTVKFFIGELVEAAKLIKNLLALIVDVLSLNSILAFFSQDIEAARKWLNKKLLWLNRTKARVEQRAAKNVEWVKREYIAKAKLSYYNSLKKQLEKQLAELKPNNATKQPQTNKQLLPAELTKENARKDTIIAVNNQLKDVNKEIQNQNDELSVNIPKDKKYWTERWRKEAEADKQLLKGGANAAA